MNVTCLILGAMLLQAPSKAPVYAEYQFQGGMDPKDFPSYDAISIVKATGQSWYSKNLRNQHIDEAIVESSVSLPVGTTVQVASFYGRSKRNEPMYTMQKGQNYFVIAKLPKNGNIVVQNETSAHILDWPTGDANQIYAMHAFATNEHLLNLQLDPIHLVFQSLVDCMDGQSLDESIRMHKFMQNMRPPELDFKPFVSYSDIPLTKQIRSIADQDRPYQRALLYQILVDWKVRGSEGPFINAMMETAQDQYAFQDPRDELISDLRFAVTLTNAGEWLKQFQSTDAFIDCLVASQNEIVSNYLFLQGASNGRADSAHVLKMANYLFEEGLPEQIQREAAGWLAGNYFQREVRPKTEWQDGKEVWLNKAACLSFWKDALDKKLIQKGLISPVMKKS